MTTSVSPGPAGREADTEPPRAAPQPEATLPKGFKTLRPDFRPTVPTRTAEAPARSVWGFGKRWAALALVQRQPRQR
ncbi:MAG: hypothetical protein J0I11_03465 [Actinobacteria bacterium]|jgi:hypothetical protein|nr:hypothetical protein [Actinomycetota bacterium]